MRLSVDLRAGGVEAAVAEMRLRAVHLASGAPTSLTADDEVSEAAMVHFIDRLGRAVARRSADHGGPRA